MGNRSVGLVSRESVRVLKDQLADACSVNQAAGKLGIGRSRVFELIRAELLPCAVRTIAGWRIPRSSVSELTELYRSLPVWESSDSSGWIPVAGSDPAFRSLWSYIRSVGGVDSGRTCSRLSRIASEWLVRTASASSGSAVGASCDL